MEVEVGSLLFFPAWDDLILFWGSVVIFAVCVLRFGRWDGMA
jgi:hypothetical protein